MSVRATAGNNEFQEGTFPTSTLDHLESGKPIRSGKTSKAKK